MNAVAQPAAALPAPIARRTRPSFVGAVRSELMKIGRQWLTWALVAGFALICVIAFGSLAASDTARSTLAGSPLTFYFQYLAGSEQLFTIAGGIFLLITGSRLVSMEYGSGTIRVVLARGTSRLGLLAAQYAALAITGLLLLAGFLVVSAAVLYAMVVARRGGFGPITTLPGAAWTDTWINLLMALLSIAVCILLATAAAAVGRSVSFGIGASLAFFPADNFGTIVMSLVTRLTHQDLWVNVTYYLLGPALNQLPVSLQTDHRTQPAFAAPLVQHIDVTHLWVVTGVYALVFLAAAVILTWRRDVLN